MFLDALTLGLGYNATLVTIGAALLGIAAGVTGSFLFLRKRALVSDAVAHATLPGVPTMMWTPLRRARSWRLSVGRCLGRSGQPGERGRC